MDFPGKNTSDNIESARFGMKNTSVAEVVVASLHEADVAAQATLAPQLQKLSGCDPGAANPPQLEKDVHR